MFTVNYSKGVTLIEVLISLSISFVLINLLYEVYLSTMKNNVIQSDLQNINFQTLSAGHLLRQSVQSAGYFGCPKLTADFPIKNNHHLLTVRNKIQGNENMLITISTGLPLGKIIKLQGLYLRIKTNMYLKPGDHLIISDCANAEVVVIKKIEKGPLGVLVSLAEDMQNQYEKNVEVAKVTVNKFHIAKSRHRLNMSSLFQNQGELLTNVDTMKIKYYVRENNKIMPITSSFISDGSQIAAIEVALHFSQPSLKVWRYFFITLNNHE